jgi:hypothetical protein
VEFKKVKEDFTQKKGEINELVGMGVFSKFTKYD